MNRQLDGFHKVVWRGRVSLARFAACTVLALGVMAPGFARAELTEADRSEYQEKASFLFNFAKFVEWTPTWHTLTNKFRIGIVDDEKAFPVIAAELAGKSVGGRGIEVVRVKQKHDLKTFDIVFVTRSQAKREESVLEKIGTAPVLTVGETSGFAAEGGIINFIPVGGKIRFEVNMGVAAKAGLKISSRLASMATVVEKKEEVR